MSIRVLIVDDSAVMRALITRKLQADKSIEVVGTARDAVEARGLIKSLDPDVVTLDVEMPGMDGLSFLAKIMELRPTPVIIVSGSTGPGAQATARAMQLGAVNCYAKSTATRSIADDDGGLLVRLVHEASQVKLPPAKKAVSRPAPRPYPPALKTAPPPVASARGAAPDLIVIGSSTGGVEALHVLLNGFPADCPPTLVVQHVNGCFAEAIARSLNDDVRPHVSLAIPDRPLSRGEVLIAPGDDRHLVVGAKLSAFSRFRCEMHAAAPVSG
ncbi:MAG: response regulator, partial [Pseudomonadota bacterium]